VTNPPKRAGGAFGRAMGTEVASGGYGASNDIFCRVVGDGAPLLLLHGLMVSGAMFVISYVPSGSKRLAGDDAGRVRHVGIRRRFLPRHIDIVC